MARTLTAANSVVAIGVTGLFNTPQQLQGYSADDVFSTDPVEPAEISMGVDGKMSAGWVAVPVPWSITLQADSLSNDFFDRWKAAQDSIREVYYAFGIVSISSIQSEWTMVRGILMSYPPIPDAGKILKPRKYGITWESISPAPG